MNIRHLAVSIVSLSPYVSERQTSTKNRLVNNNTLTFQSLVGPIITLRELKVARGLIEMLRSVQQDRRCGVGIVQKAANLLPTNIWGTCQH